ncbi:MMPL family transporter [Nocardioides nitrophenolicus]|uniref:MMPL family transporter n=1 Tax=Nocardioides nitrophenolicus TaxID=60489 RepID=UPI001958C583|nr:MMPL family transporter [Nocardioides nitrophenolicus]MBM7515510.1 RND superfamily putative drug exporter [Nocardioides nitrophenolicus]
MTRRARTVLGLGLLGVVLAAVVGVGAFGKLQTAGFDDPDSESSRAASLLEERFAGGADYVFVVEAVGGDIDAPAAARAGAALTERLRADPALADVASYFDTRAGPMRSTDGRYALVTASLAPGTEADPGAVIDAYAGADGPLSVDVGGGEVVGEEVGARIGQDLGLAESIAIPLILVLLVLAFGNVVGALVTLAVGVAAIFGTFAELSILGSVTDVSIYAVNLTTGLGLGLAVDYGLLMVARVREERAAGRAHPDAVRRAVETAGRTIAFSATTVAVALAALLVFPMYFLRSFAYAGIGVMLITAFAAIVVLPAGISLLGDRIDAWRVPRVRGIRGEEAPAWARLARFVARRPLLSALPVLAGLLVVAIPLAGIELGTPDDRVLPTSATSRQAGDVLRSSFAGDGTHPIQVVTTTSVPEAELTSYAATLGQLPDVVRVDVQAGRDADLVAVVTDLDPMSAAARALVDEVRAVPAPGGAEALVGGASAELHDQMTGIGDRLPLVAGWLVLTTLVILFLFTGSVVQPLRALVLNAVGLGATLGAMVWVFQDGHLSGVLGFTPQPMDSSMMVLLFCVAFGLSMDYEVFVMSRIKEMRDRGLANDEAMIHGLAHTGRIVSTAAALIAISFFAFLVSSVSFIQFFGLGTGLAILIDATLVRGVLLPASVRLLGERSWWAPGPLRALHRRVGLSESVPSVAPTRQKLAQELR